MTRENEPGELERTRLSGLLGYVIAKGEFLEACGIAKSTWSDWMSRGVESPLTAEHAVNCADYYMEWGYDISRVDVMVAWDIIGREEVHANPTMTATRRGVRRKPRKMRIRADAPPL